MEIGTEELYLYSSTDIEVNNFGHNPNWFVGNSFDLNCPFSLVIILVLFY